MKILVATQNRGKFKEILEVFDELPHEFLSFADLDMNTEFEENGETFGETALAKARHFANLSGLPTLADDSGIIVDVLKDELGLRTRRWGAGENASDEEWISYFMKRMENEKRRSARFLCAAAFVNQEIEKVFIGETTGVITSDLEAPIYSGIPLSSVFKPDGYNAVYAALSIVEKNKISHRGKAFNQLFNTLKNA